MKKKASERGKTPSAKTSAAITSIMESAFLDCADIDGPLRDGVFRLVRDPASGRDEIHRADGHVVCVFFPKVGPTTPEVRAMLRGLTTYLNQLPPKRGTKR